MDSITIRKHGGFQLLCIAAYLPEVDFTPIFQVLTSQTGTNPKPLLRPLTLHQSGTKRKKFSHSSVTRGLLSELSFAFCP